MPTMTDATCSRSRRRNAILSYREVEIAFSGWLNKMTSSTASGPLALLIGLGILALSKKRPRGRRTSRNGGTSKRGRDIDGPEAIGQIGFSIFCSHVFPPRVRNPNLFLVHLGSPRVHFSWPTGHVLVDSPRCCKSGRSAGRPQAIMPRPGLQREEKGQRSAPNLHTRVQLVQLNPAA